jgi:hypothetical protein
MAIANSIIRHFKFSKATGAELIKEIGEISDVNKDFAEQLNLKISKKAIGIIPDNIQLSIITDRLCVIHPIAPHRIKHTDI